MKTSVESSIYESPSHHDIISPKTSPTIQVPKVRPQLPVEPIIRIQEPPPPYSEMKQLITAQQNFQRMMESKLPGPPLMPVINGTRSLSDKEAKSLLDDLNRGNNLLRSPTALLPGNPLLGTKPLVPPELLSEYSRLGLFNTSNKIHDILKGVLTRKRLIEDTDPALEKETKMHAGDMQESEKKMMGASTDSPPVTTDSDTATLPSFLQYIGKELETLPYDCQEKAKKEIFRVISDLKKQSVMFMVPHHWQLANMAAARQHWNTNNTKWNWLPVYMCSAPGRGGVPDHVLKLIAADSSYRCLVNRGIESLKYRVV